MYFEKQMIMNEIRFLTKKKLFEEFALLIQDAQKGVLYVQRKLILS